MKQNLEESQTAKLIEMGFEKPKTIVDKYYDFDAEDYKEVNHYSVGELLSFLPKEIDSNGLKNTLYIFVNQDGWDVEYSDFLGELYSTYRSEFIDAIFDMCVELKEEGVI